MRICAHLQSTRSTNPISILATGMLVCVRFPFLNLVPEYSLTGGSVLSLSQYVDMAGVVLVDG